MKKVMIALCLLAFTGATTATYAAVNTVKTEVKKDDKKKKKSKKKSGACSTQSTGGGCCSKPAGGSTQK